MTTLTLVLATALLLGALHAFDPDHLAAVTAFIARRPSAPAALAFALRWGLGHAATLLAVGLASTLFRVTLTPSAEAAAELAVGGMLVVVGVWVLAGIARGRLVLGQHVHDGHAHSHLHRPGHSRGLGRAARHSIFWVGALHGLAGSAALLVVIPVGMMTSPLSVIGYIATFSLGVMTAMAGYALLIGGLLNRTLLSRGRRLHPWLAGAAGAASLLLGLVWISSTLTGSGA